MQLIRIAAIIQLQEEVALIAVQIEPTLLIQQEIILKLKVTLQIQEQILILILILILIPTIAETIVTPLHQEVMTIPVQPVPIPVEEDHQAVDHQVEEEDPLVEEEDNKNHNN